MCDRCVDSTFAYQVYGKRVKKNLIEQIHKTILQDIKPDITFILKVSPKVSKLRLKKEKQRIGMIILLSLFIQMLKNHF